MWKLILREQLGFECVAIREITIVTRNDTIVRRCTFKCSTEDFKSLKDGGKNDVENSKDVALGFF